MYNSLRDDGSNVSLTYQCTCQGVSGALTVLMKDAVRPNLMQTLEVWFTGISFNDVLDYFSFMIK